MSKPMREVSKSTPREGGDGPPSSIKNSVKAKKGHKQTGGAKKSAENDAFEQTKKNRQVSNADPFRELMAAASRNSRYALPMEQQGTVDPNDPMGASVDEHDNAPKMKRKS